MAWVSLGLVTVSVAGTPVRLTVNQSVPAARVPCHAILVQAKPGNSSYLVIGTASVNASTYANALAVIAAPATNVIPSINASIADEVNGFNAADYYLDAASSGDAAIVSILVA